MSKVSADRITTLRRTSVRGVETSRLLFTVSTLIICGFAFGSIEEREATAISDEISEVSEVEAHVPRRALSPELQRERLLSDVHALHEATLWLARCLYSETDRRHEQILVAWVVRNRVETRYRGESTYAGVINDPFQFSAFNPNSEDRHFFLSIDTTNSDRGWRQALSVARQVILADADERPFPITTRHFYSERSLGDSDIPEWAVELDPIEVKPFTVDERRFRFFDRVF